MNDRELTELAAKAAGEDVQWQETHKAFFRRSCSWPEEKGWFIPLHRDDEALRLATTLQLDILQDTKSVSIKKWCSVNAEATDLACEYINGDRLASTRRAIVLAAAAIGGSMP